MTVLKRLLVFVIAMAALPSALSGVARAQDVDELASVPRITLEAFKKLLASDGVIVLDVRDEASYGAGHIPGAISVPLHTVADRAAELKKAKKPIVTYCA